MEYPIFSNLGTTDIVNKNSCNTNYSEMSK